MLAQFTDLLKEIHALFLELDFSADHPDVWYGRWEHPRTHVWV